MSIKLVILKSGEDVIADVEEMLVNEKPVGYFFSYPCRVKLIGKAPQKDGNSRLPFKMELTPWAPLSKTQRIPVVADWVITIMEPIDDLRRMYERGLKEYERRKSAADSVDEQPDDSDSD